MEGRSNQINSHIVVIIFCGGASGGDFSQQITSYRRFHQMSDPKVMPNEYAPKIEAHTKASRGADENKLLAFALAAPLLHIRGSF